MSPHHSTPTKKPRERGPGLLAVRAQSGSILESWAVVIAEGLEDDSGVDPLAACLPLIEEEGYGLNPRSMVCS